MTPAEEAFVRSIRQNIRTSKQFRLATQAGLTSFMGATPAEVLVMGISPEAFKSPAQFVREISKVFGQGAIPIYTAIVAASEDPEVLVDNGDGTVVYKPMKGGLGANEIGSVAEKTHDFYLHDQRDPDDFAEEDLH